MYALTLGQGGPGLRAPLDPLLFVLLTIVGLHRELITISHLVFVRYLHLFLYIIRYTVLSTYRQLHEAHLKSGYLRLQGCQCAVVYIVATVQYS